MLYSLVTIALNLCILIANLISAVPVLNVHIVPHSHDDVGWLKTVDQYYVGSRTILQRAGVRYILDTTIQELLKDPSKKFIYVEVAFFERWWQEQTDELREKVKQLVANRQLVFINGGWVMNDEACVYFQSVIDQMTLGHRFLNDTFGIQPTIGWAVDPFGHSSQQASAFADMGFNAFVLGRVDDDDRGFRKKQRTLEFVWEPSRSEGPKKQILGAITPDGYYPPSGFCFDVNCDDDPIQDRTDLFDDNLEEKAEQFSKEVRQWADWYRSGDIMLTMGGDFHFSNAHVWFSNLDKLIAYFNSNVEKYQMNLFYSTPVEYFKKRNQDPVPFSTKSDDFFPYGTFQRHGYWVGYFTSRPALKRLERVSNAHLQVCKQLQSLADIEGDVETLKRAMAIAQHHDAVSGTEKQHVADDYAKRLDIGNAQCDNVINDAMKQLSSSEHVEFIRCHNLNVSICHVSQQSDNFFITVYNSQVQESSTIVSIPVNSPSWSVKSTEEVPTQVYSNIPDQSSLTESSIYTLSFEVSVPGLGFAVYEVHKTVSDLSGTPWVKPDTSGPEEYVLQNDQVRVQFDPETGRIASIINKVDGCQVELDQHWATYLSHDGRDDSAASGAYIFRPETQEPGPIRTNLNSIRFNRGPLLNQAHVTFGDMIHQTVRLKAGSEAIEIDFTVGPIDVSDGSGKEAVTRFTTNIESKDLFWSDSNGREMIERRRNYRKTWPLVNLEPVASNYVPVTTAISINDEKTAFTVLTDRSQGGTSLQSGQIELMVHRRTLHDDHLGVAEPLNEPGLNGHGLIIRGVHTLLVSKKDRAAALHRTYQEHIVHPLSLLFSTILHASQIPTRTFSSLKSSLPVNIQIVTLEKIGNNRVIVRLGHKYAVDEDVSLSEPTQVNLQDLFKQSCISAVNELNLSANQLKSSMDKWKWKTTDNEGFNSFSTIHTDPSPPIVTISAMDIRTWEVTLSKCQSVQLEPISVGIA